MAQTQPRDRYDVIVIGGRPGRPFGRPLHGPSGPARPQSSPASWAGRRSGPATSRTTWLGAHPRGRAGRAFPRPREQLRRGHVRRSARQRRRPVGRRRVRGLYGGRPQFVGRAGIIASGKAPARLAVPGRRSSWDAASATAPTCDAAFFRGRPVVVFGPGRVGCRGRPAAGGPGRPRGPRSEAAAAGAAEPARQARRHGQRRRCSPVRTWPASWVRRRSRPWSLQEGEGRRLARGGGSRHLHRDRLCTGRASSPAAW